jgi:hypothetical protein
MEGVASITLRYQGKAWAILRAPEFYEHRKGSRNNWRSLNNIWVPLEDKRNMQVPIKLRCWKKFYIACHLRKGEPDVCF